VLGSSTNSKRFGRKSRKTLLLSQNPNSRKSAGLTAISRWSAGRIATGFLSLCSSRKNASGGVGLDVKFELFRSRVFRFPRVFRWKTREKKSFSNSVFHKMITDCLGNLVIWIAGVSCIVVFSPVVVNYGLKRGIFPNRGIWNFPEKYTEHRINYEIKLRSIKYVPIIYNYSIKHVIRVYRVYTVCFYRFPVF
jgi:hypothetical protein